MASTDARPIPRKNTAFRVTFPILDADGDLVTGASGLDSEVSKDGGTFADCTNEATEIATASGMYYLDLTSDEMNADTVAVIVKTSTSGAKTTPLVLYPEEATDIRVNVTAISDDATAADNAKSFFNGTGYGEVLQRTTIATLSSQTSFTLTAGSADNDAYNGCVIVVQDASTATQKAVGVIADYTGSTRTVTLLNDPAIFTMATTDVVTILADRSLKPTVDNRTLDVTATGAAGIDWGNVENQDATVVLENTETSQVGQVGLLASGAITVGAFADNSITAGAIADSAASEIATNVWAVGTRTITGGTIGTITGLTIANVENASTQFLTMIELDGAVYRYTTNALEQAPSGGGPGGDPLENVVPGDYASGTAGWALGRIGNGTITTVSVVAQGGEVTIVRGDAYTTMLGRALSWTDEDAQWPELTDAVITMEIGDGSVIGDGEVVTATGANKQVRVQLSSTSTNNLGEGVYDYNVVATFAGTGTDDYRVTLARDVLTVEDREDS